METFVDAYALRVDDGGMQEQKTAVKLSVENYSAPAFWASYYINGDASGIGDGAELYEADKFLAERNLPAPVSCGEEYVGTFNGKMTMMTDYAFLI